MVFVAKGVDDFPVSGIGKGVVGSLGFIAVGWYLFSPFVDKEGLVIFGLL